MTDPFIRLSRARLQATGASLSVSPPNLAPKCSTDAEVEALVRHYYMFFYERLAKDISFLAGVQPDRRISSAQNLLHILRTSANHSDNPAAERQSKQWHAQHKSPQAAADSLAVCLGAALEALSQIAIAVARDPIQAEKWRELVSIEVATVFAAVCIDLGLNFTENNRKRMIRLVEKRLQVHPRHGDQRVLTAEYCAQEILSDQRPLPVPYNEVLDSLGLLGKPQARAALLIAHSVAEVTPELSSNEFIARVMDTWRFAVA